MTCEASPSVISRRGGVKWPHQINKSIHTTTAVGSPSGALFPAISEPPPLVPHPEEETAMNHPDGCASSVPQNENPATAPESDSPRPSWAVRQLNVDNSFTKLVLMVIAINADMADSDEIDLSMEEIVKDSRLTAQETEEAVDKLTASGLIARNGTTYVVRAGGLA
jgi:hypothetical protein